MLPHVAAATAPALLPIAAPLRAQPGCGVSARDTPRQIMSLLHATTFSSSQGVSASSSGPPLISSLQAAQIRQTVQLQKRSSSDMPAAHDFPVPVVTPQPPTYYRFDRTLVESSRTHNYRAYFMRGRSDPRYLSTRGELLPVDMGERLLAQFLALPAHVRPRVLVRQPSALTLRYRPPVQPPARVVHRGRRKIGPYARQQSLLTTAFDVASSSHPAIAAAAAAAAATPTLRHDDDLESSSASTDATPSVAKRPHL